MPAVPREAALELTCVWGQSSTWVWVGRHGTGVNCSCTSPFFQTPSWTLTRSSSGKGSLVSAEQPRHGQHWDTLPGTYPCSHAVGPSPAPSHVFAREEPGALAELVPRDGAVQPAGLCWGRGAGCTVAEGLVSLNRVQSWGSPGLLTGTGQELKSQSEPQGPSQTCLLHWDLGSALSPVPPSSFLHASLSLCLSHLLLFTPGLPSIPWDIPDLILDCLSPCTGSSLLNDGTKNCSPSSQCWQQEEHGDRLAHQGAPRHDSQLGQGMGSTAEGLLP